MATSQTQGFVFGQQSIAAAGTAEALVSEHTLVSGVLIIAHADNSGQIFYGGVDVDSSTQAGLDAGESVFFETSVQAPFDLQEIFIDAAANDDGVDFVGVRSRRVTL